MVTWLRLGLEGLHLIIKRSFLMGTWIESIDDLGMHYFTYIPRYNASR